MDLRLKRASWGAGKPRVRTSPRTWDQVLKWNGLHHTFFTAHGRRQRVFCASLADVFDNDVEPAWRTDLFRLIADTQNLDWLLLTKRIGNVAAMLREIGIDRLPGNVWLGATIVNQAEADRDIPKLLAVPARVRFLSMEPLLERVDLAASGALWSDMNGNIVDAPSRGLRGVDWVIVGGESGHGARPMHPDWARSLRDQCAAAGVPFLFKQWGEWMPAERDGITVTLRFSDPSATGPKQPDWLAWPDGQITARVNKRAAGRLLDGRTHDEFPGV